MGEVDAKLDRYLSDSARYADLINAYRFNGRQIVKPEDVKEKDTRLSGRSKRIQKKRKNQNEHQKVRDIVRKVVFGTGIAVIAFENQNLIHYAMPVRTLVEDALEYDKQLREIQRGHRHNKDLKVPAEYIGQFSADDKIIPAATIVLYFGEDDWNGPRDLLDLMELEDLPEEIRQMINGYPLHILEVRKFKDIDKFQTDLREVFGIIQKSNNKKELLAYTNSHRERLENLDEEAYDVIASITGNSILLDRKTEYQKGDGTMNLCKGMADWAADERREGKLEGRLEGKSEIAQNAFSMGFDVEKVATLCGESLELIQTWFNDWRNSVATAAHD